MRNNDRTSRRITIVCLGIAIIAGVSTTNAQPNVDRTENRIVPAEIDEYFLDHSGVQVELAGDDKGPTVLFVGSAYKETPDSPDFLTHEPGILIQQNDGTWKRLRLAWMNTGWLFIGATPDRRYIWGILDSIVESPGWELQVIRSADGGRTWDHTADLRKHWYMNAFKNFAMDASGHGIVDTVHSWDDADAREGDTSKVGTYTFETRDWGATWSGPVFSRNVVRRLNPSRNHVPRMATSKPIRKYISNDRQPEKTGNGIRPQR